MEELIANRGGGAGAIDRHRKATCRRDNCQVRFTRHGPKLIMLQRYREARIIAADHSAKRDELQRRGPIQKRWPLYREF